MAEHAAARAVVLRQHLSAILGCADDSIRIERTAGGKPVLASPCRDLWFSTAHRDGLLAIAVSRQGPVGVDVETLAHCQDDLGLAWTLFSPTEADWLGRLPPSERSLAFARLWTGKEAVLKAAGTGIVQGLAEPEFAPASPPWPPVVAKLDNAPYTVGWYTSTVDEAMVVTARAVSAAGRFSGIA